MKKQIKKLSLSKRTVLNLNSNQMSAKVGGASDYGCSHYCHGHTIRCSNGNSCYNHNTCNTCI
jgi:hypothetical protein